MVGAAGCKCVLRVLAVLLVSFWTANCLSAKGCPWERCGLAHCSLPSNCPSALCHLIVEPGGPDVLFLCYKFNITPKPRPGQPWCESQGQVNGNIFLKDTCSSQKAEPIGLLGMKLNSTEAWKDLLETMKDLKGKLRKKLLDTEEAMIKTRDLLTLQVQMMCSWKDSRHTRGFWDFEFNGQSLLHFDSENKIYIGCNSGGELMKKMWENDKELTEILTQISRGDCRRWLENVKKVLDTTATPTTAPDTIPSEARTNDHLWWILPVIVGVLATALYIKRHAAQRLLRVRSSHYPSLG